MNRILALALSLCFMVTYGVSYVEVTEPPKDQKSLQQRQVDNIVVPRVSNPQQREDDSHIKNPDGYDQLMYTLCNEKGLAYMGKRDNCLPMKRGD